MPMSAMVAGDRTSRDCLPVLFLFAIEPIFRGPFQLRQEGIELGPIIIVIRKLAVFASHGVLPNMLAPLGLILKGQPATLLTSSKSSNLS